MDRHGRAGLVERQHLTVHDLEAAERLDDQCAAELGDVLGVQNT